MSSSHKTGITLEQIPTSITPDTPSSEISHLLKEENIAMHHDVIDYVKHAYWRCMNARDRATNDVREDKTLEPDFRNMLVLAKNQGGTLIEFRKYRDAA